VNGILEANMFMKHGKKLLALAATLSLLVFAQIGVGSTPSPANPAVPKNQPVSLTDQVRHELVMLPWLGVFDNIAFSVEDSNTVVLSGQVLRPILKSDAEAMVKRIPGVSKVVNNIEVLPLSRFDDSIRIRTYWAIFSMPGFEKYAVQAISPIRIIVKNGNVTLTGFVGTKLEKSEAAFAAQSIPGVFSVTDNLVVG
jgi:hyperosmotically inducible protein